ncbi:hypothetical protein GCM10010468_22890 [Actinocorallia longicatena]|uniref:Iminophenyl-pyruvate dimer synthase domain-containing protein n=1 Tax=Actinocorallia longicatena TaxID=111803 RepID=A0ABP6Q6D9_9ACTN
MFAVEDRESALGALREIIDRGEGKGHGEVWDGDQEAAHPDRNEVAHYHRLLELERGRRFRPGDTAESGPTGDGPTFTCVPPSHGT